MASVSFKGGARLEAKLKDMAAKAAKPETLRVGFLEGATYPDGTSVAMVAAIQNYGAPAAGIPARPFFNDMVSKKSPNWGKSLGNLVKKSGYDLDEALHKMGEGIRGQLQDEITSFAGEPLAASTAAQKGSPKQLVDTGHMLNSVDFEVSNK